MLFTKQDIADWRQQQADKGLPCGFLDYFKVMCVCPVCKTDDLSCVYCGNSREWTARVDNYLLGKFINGKAKSIHN